jgi:hypothetical protein
MDSMPFTSVISFSWEPLMSRSTASLALAFLIASIPSFTGMLIALGMATPLPDLPQNSATRQTSGSNKAEIAARLKQIVDAYKAQGNKATPLQEQISTAAQVLLEADKGIVLEFTVPPLANQQALNQFKNNLAQIQMNAGLTQFKLDTALEELDGVAKLRVKESKLWQARYDYVRARLAADIAYVYEYNAQLGQMRKEVPPLDKNNQTSWQLAPGGMMLDRDAAKYARKAKAILDNLAKTQAGGDWERIAQDEILSAEAGLRWVPAAK